MDGPRVEARSLSERWLPMSLSYWRRREQLALRETEKRKLPL